MPDTLRVEFIGAELAPRFTVYTVGPLDGDGDWSPIELVRWPARDPRTGENLPPAIDIPDGTVRDLSCGMFTLGNPGPSRRLRFYPWREGKERATLAQMTDGRDPGPSAGAAPIQNAGRRPDPATIAQQISDFRALVDGLQASIQQQDERFAKLDENTRESIRGITAHMESLKKPLKWHDRILAWLAPAAPVSDEEIPF